MMRAMLLICSQVIHSDLDIALASVNAYEIEGDQQQLAHNNIIIMVAHGAPARADRT